MYSMGLWPLNIGRNNNTSTTVKLPINPTPLYKDWFCLRMVLSLLRFEYAQIGEKGADHPHTETADDNEKGPDAENLQGMSGGLGYGQDLHLPNLAGRAKMRLTKPASTAMA
jgi:hypothetical protein